MLAVKDDFEVLYDEVGTGNLINLASDVLNLDMNDDTVKKALERSSKSNYLEVASLGKYKISLTELVELNSDEGTFEAFEYLINLHRRDDKFKRQILRLIGTIQDSNLIYVFTNIDIVKKKLDREFDKKFRKLNLRKGTRKLVTKCALISLANNKNII